MKYWVQYLAMSTGYIPGTIPPQFGKPELIDACGDTGVFVLDGRNSYQTMLADARNRAQRLEHWRKYPAFVICKGPRFFEETQRGAINHLSYPIGVAV